MKTIAATINGVDIVLLVRNTGNRGADIQRAAQAYCKEHGIDWLSAEVFAAQGEKGRCYEKNPGFLTLGAHG